MLNSVSYQAQSLFSIGTSKIQPPLLPVLINLTSHSLCTVSIISIIAMKKITKLSCRASHRKVDGLSIAFELKVSLDLRQAILLTINFRKTQIQRELIDHDNTNKNEEEELQI
jgi:hypothetical protein